MITKEYFLYNTVTHETITLCDYSDENCIAALQNQGYYMLSEEKYGDKYEYPAIYKSPGIVWDQSSENKVNGDWMMTSRDGGDSDNPDDQSQGGSSNSDNPDDQSQGGSSKGLNYILYNSQTHESFSISNDLSSSSWMLLNKSSYPDYNHPAVYDTSTHTAIDQDSDPSTTNGWMIVSKYNDTYTSSTKSLNKIKYQSEVSSFKLKKPFKMDEEIVGTCIVGTKGKDKILGSDFSEMLIGGSGRNIFEGGASADGFIFDNKSDFGSKSIDKINDFNASEGDKILLDKEAFGFSKKMKFKTVSNKKGLMKSALTGKDLIYFQDKGLLYFNENGKDDGWGDGGKFVKLIGTPDLNANDFDAI